MTLHLATLEIEFLNVHGVLVEVSKVTAWALDASSRRSTTLDHHIIHLMVELVRPLSDHLVAAQVALWSAVRNALYLISRPGLTVTLGVDLDVLWQAHLLRHHLGLRHLLVLNLTLRLLKLLILLRCCI